MKRKLDFHLVESDGLLLIQPKPWGGEQSRRTSVLTGVLRLLLRVRDMMVRGCHERSANHSPAR